MSVDAGAAPGGRWVAANPTSFAYRLDEDLIVVSMLPFFDMITLMKMRLVDTADETVVTKYRTQLAYAIMLAKSARTFLISRITELHQSCAGRAPDAMASSALAHAEKFACLLVGPRSAFATRKSVRTALQNAFRVGPALMDKWPWKSVIRFLLPVAASYGDIWPDASFAVEVCARSLQNRELLTLFAPDPCQALEVIAREHNDDLGISVAAILGSMIRALTNLTAPIILPVAEMLTSKVLNRAKTRTEFSFILACMALVEKIRIRHMPETVPTSARKALLPGLMYSSVGIKKVSRIQRQEVDVYTRLLGIEVNSRLRPHFEQTFVCAAHPTMDESRSVADILLSAFTRTYNPRPLLRQRSGAHIADDHYEPDEPSTNATGEGHEANATAAESNDAPDTEENGLGRELSVNATEGGPSSIAPEEVAAMVNDIAARAGVNAAELFGHFLGQGSEAIGVRGDEEEENTDSSADADTADGTLEERQGNPAGEVQTADDVARLIDSFASQMASAASLESDDSDDELPELEVV